MYALLITAWLSFNRYNRNVKEHHPRCHWIILPANQINRLLGMVRRRTTIPPGWLTLRMFSPALALLGANQVVGFRTDENGWTARYKTEAPVGRTFISSLVKIARGKYETAIAFLQPGEKGSRPQDKQKEFQAKVRTIFYFIVIVKIANVFVFTGHEFSTYQRVAMLLFIW